MYYCTKTWKKFILSKCANYCHLFEYSMWSTCTVDDTIKYFENVTTIIFFSPREMCSLTWPQPFYTYNPCTKLHRGSHLITVVITAAILKLFNNLSLICHPHITSYSSILPTITYLHHCFCGRFSRNLERCIAMCVFRLLKSAPIRPPMAPIMMNIIRW